MWGLLTIYWKHLEAFDPFELIGWRILCSTRRDGGRRHRPGPLGRRHRGAARPPHGRAPGGSPPSLLTANWTSYVWAVTNDRVLETALGYFMAPLATMVLGIVVLHEPASRLHRVGPRAGAPRRCVVLTVSYGRPPWIALVIAVSWSMYGLLKRRVALSPVESLAGETFMLDRPGARARGRAWPATAAASRTRPPADSGCSWRSRVSSPPSRCCCSPYAAQRVPFTLLGALQYLVPTINLVLGWAVYDEPMPPERLFGFVLVWIALLLITLDRVGTPAQRAARPRRGGCRRRPAGNFPRA